MEKPPIHLATDSGRPVSPPTKKPVKHRPGSKRGKLARTAAARLAAGFTRSQKWKPTLAERRLIAVSMAAGMTQPQVAGIVGVDEKTLRRHCRVELDDGAAKVNAKVAGKLFTKCMKGDTIALIYWTKTRMGWRENNKLELTGKDGGPIQHEQVQAEADAFTARISSMADRFAAIAAPPDDKPAANDGELTQKSIAQGENP